jgi:hypothetical protein
MQSFVSKALGKVPHDWEEDKWIILRWILERRVVRMGDG